MKFFKYIDGEELRRKPIKPLSKVLPKGYGWCRRISDRDMHLLCLKPFHLLFQAWDWLIFKWVFDWSFRRR